MCNTFSHNHSATLIWHYLVEERQREMAAYRRWVRKRGLKRSHWAYQPCVGKDENIEERAKTQWTKPLTNVWNHSITHAKILPVQLWKAAQGIRRAVLYLIKKSREILTNTGFLLPILQDLQKTTQTPFYSQCIITRFHLYLLLLTNKNICERALVSVSVFGTNDLITMAWNLCTHLFYSFPALSKSSMTQAYLESDSRV